MLDVPLCEVNVRQTQKTNPEKKPRKQTYKKLEKQTYKIRTKISVARKDACKLQIETNERCKLDW